MTDSLLYLLIVTFFVSMFAFKIVVTAIVEKDKYEKRVNKYLPTSHQEEDEPKKKKKKNRNNSILRQIARSIESAIKLSKYERLLTQAGVKLTQGEFFIGRVVMAFITMSIGYLYDLHVLLLVLCGMIGFYIPVMYAKRKHKKRLQKCSDQLSIALGTMANAMRAGFSFMQAMKMVAEEIEEPLGPEFLKALKDINYGVSVEDAFASLQERLPNKELEIVLHTLFIQRTSGGNLAHLLETMQETIFDRARVKDEVKTLTAQGKMSSVIITLLPVGLAVYLQLVNPEYFQTLFSHPLGWVMVVVGGFNIIVGWLFIKKIVHIEV